MCATHVHNKPADSTSTRTRIKIKGNNFKPLLDPSMNQPENKGPTPKQFGPLMVFQIWNLLLTY